MSAGMSASATLQTMLQNDTIYQAMKNPSVKWGDLFYNLEREEKLPTLYELKDIWRYFPVAVANVGDGRYIVKWHRKNLIHWRETKSRNAHEWIVYESIIHNRLMQALKASNKWRIDPPTQSDEICILVEHNDPIVLHYEPSASDVYMNVPILTSLNDIKQFFPVVWHTIPNAPKKTFAIELFQKKVAEISRLKHNEDVSYKIRSELLESLKKSGAWKVLDPVLPGEVCRIQMM